MNYSISKEFAIEADQADELRLFRDRFLFPQHHGENKVYFTGNSLGLQPKGASESIQQELRDWEQYGVDGHFDAKNPWYSYHELFRADLSKIVGALESEVAAMGSLTNNLHLLMVSFYRPAGKKTKILCETKAFPSDQYALESQVKFHGLSPEEHIVELIPRQGEYHIREEDIMSKIEELGEELALIMIGGVNYYTGQVMPMASITEKGHQVGAVVGFDLAHAAGNIKLNLHDWGVDFASWCSYKYLNSGPGSVAGIYVHDRHADRSDLPRFAGWWGTPSEGRFKMEKGFKHAYGADGWQLSNAPVFAMAIHRLAIQIHIEAGIDRLVKKQKALTGYLEYTLNVLSEEIEYVDFEIITPVERGSQLSILTHGNGKELFEGITRDGVVADWREPNVIRVAPVPLYNSFQDVYEFGAIIRNNLKKRG